MGVQRDYLSARSLTETETFKDLNRNEIQVISIKGSEYRLWVFYLLYKFNNVSTFVVSTFVPNNDFLAKIKFKDFFKMFHVLVHSIRPRNSNVKEPLDYDFRVSEGSRSTLRHLKKVQWKYSVWVPTVGTLCYRYWKDRHVYQEIKLRLLSCRKKEPFMTKNPNCEVRVGRGTLFFFFLGQVKLLLKTDGYK